MKSVKASSVDQIAIPKDAQTIFLSKEPRWKKLEGVAAGTDLIKLFAAFKKRERAIEKA